MRLGFVTELSDERIALAAALGLDGVEVAIGWGTALHPETATDADCRAARELLDKHGVAALTLLWGENHAELDDPVKRLKRVIKTAKVLGTSVITTNCWAAGSTLSEQHAWAVRLWSKCAKIAEDGGVRVGFENCPHDGRNYMRTPATFAALFDAVPSPAIGLEFDPSHLIFQFIDPVPAIRAFGERIYAFHAKDTQILDDRLQQVGVSGEGWWRFRVPGFGDVDWRAIFIALSDVNYAGDIIIEHEDPVFGGSEGLALAAQHLRPFIAPSKIG
ncbi:MAG: sugar phosphate isomerase/epimerase [Verrucomicrobia bacterium]|nr:sugar phosphate isomerase/epimerase [Verrucomicrobiota bacterium]